MLTLATTALPGWVIGPFTRTGIINPILGPNPQSEFRCPMNRTYVKWEHDHVFNPAAVELNGIVYLLYRAEDNHGTGIGGHTSRIGLADSTDGVHFSKRKTPILFPSNDPAKKYEWPGGCEDPRIVRRSDGLFVLTYTAWDRKMARLSIATSPDLIHWKKLGPAFKNTPYVDQWSKSGSIVTKVAKGKLVAAKIKGRYWMYWGEGSLKVATSKDLISWAPVAKPDGTPLGVMSTRAHCFDSDLVEPGPPAVLTNKGIVLIYNGKNASQGGDPQLGPNAYAAGQALFDPNNPAKLLNRTESYFIKPELASETTGQYVAGTVFAEGLALKNGKWYLYFGAADSFVGVAVASR